ncbi:hypothetical protein [Natronocalculus amylovorans]|uniref:Uncharacterized protein n=1 Tax=Natronocalculus amylovorans TaxID=2917812 RepID=A0AAE3G039_9EURY|nr:hypothetical protein [Natronocalculus amylovorans]MCL9818385.1 hypothetical protein [Natronocalculus amylovorans]
MGVVKFEGENGTQQISSVLDYSEEMSAWIIDVSEGGIEDIGQNVDRLIIPEHRIYEVQLTSSELEERRGPGTF